MSTAARMAELAALRVEVSSLRALAGLYDKNGQGHACGQRRMASRVLKAIDERLEALDREGCQSEDNIDEGVRA